MHQVGAALTDWSVGGVCILSTIALYRHGRFRQLPRWYRCVMGAYFSEGLACLAGGFMWARGTNKFAVTMNQLTAIDHIACCPMMLGMAAEGFFLILTSRALRKPSEDTSIILWSLGECIGFAACVILYIIITFNNMSLSITYQLLIPLALGLVFFLWTSATLYRESTNNTSEQLCWLKVFCGAALNTFGAAVLGLLDNDCTGVGCITEFLPWESSPCRFGTVDPRGSSCLVPEWFNHAAIMHTLAIISAIVAIPALCELLDLDRESPGCKSHKQ